MKYYLILLFIGLGLFISCDDDNNYYEVGENFIETNTQVIQIDTISIDTATIIADSLITSNSSRLLIGALQDEIFGNLKAQSYLGLTTSSFDIDKEAVFDSISLILHYDRYYYGDTTQVVTYKIHEITETFEPNDEEDALYFYNTSSLRYDSEILGETSFIPYPNKKDSISITLKKEFGENLFDKIIDNDINNLDELESEFKGITIVPDENNNTVLGFKYSSDNTGYDFSSIRLFYTIKDDDSEDNDYHIDFTINGTNKVFNSIVSDRTTTELQSLENSEDILPSSQTSNKMYLQSGTGLGMRVEIPNARLLNDLENNGTTLSAILKMYPDKSSYNDIELINSLAVYIVDSKNRVVSQLTNLGGETVYANLYSENSEFDTDTYFITDISAYVEELQTNYFGLDYALRFEFVENETTITKLLINDQTSPEDPSLKMELQLTYLKY